MWAYEVSKNIFARLKLKKSSKIAISKCPVVLGNLKIIAKITKNHEIFFSLKLYLYVVCVYRWHRGTLKVPFEVSKHIFSTWVRHGMNVKTVNFWWFTWFYSEIAAWWKWRKSVRNLLFFQNDFRQQTKLENASEKSQTCLRDPYAFQYALFYLYVYIYLWSEINNVLQCYSNIEHE